MRDELERAVALALAEDLGEASDVTTTATVDEHATGRAELVAKAAGVVCGLEALDVTFERTGGGVRVDHRVTDGAMVKAGDVLAVCDGSVRTMLTGERTALNLIGHLSGVATLTAAFVERAPGTTIVDTRKTLPGLRTLEKYAVRCGGGTNHRLSLADGVLVKDNHIVAAGGVAAATARAKASATLPVQVECESLDDIAAASDAGADSVLIDNFTPEDAAAAVRRFGGDLSIEASGGVTLDTVADYAAAGVVRISIGALTHSAPALDVSFRLVEVT